MKLIITTLFISLQFSIFGQIGQLEEIFQAYETVNFDSDGRLSELSKNRSSRIEFSIGKWDLVLHDSGLLSDDFLVRTSSGQEKKYDSVYPLIGETKRGGIVSLTIASGFVQGFIAIGGVQYNFEPLRHFLPEAKKNELILYKSKDLKTDISNICAREEIAFDISKKADHKSGAKHRSTGLCYEIEYAIASDYSMYEKYGLNELIARNIGILNDVNTNFVSSFENEIRIVLRGQFVSDCANCDPWTTSLDFTTLLDNFRSWSNSTISNPSHPEYIPNDIASLWSDRWESSLVVGQAYLGGLCTDDKYNVVSDFSTNANALRVLLAHEIGHNLNAFHDPPGTSSIMAPNINITNFWSAASKTVINAYVTSAECSPFCSDLPATVYWDSPVLEMQELTEDLDEDACIKGYKDYHIPIKITEIPSNLVTVGISINPGRAKVDIDFKLLTDEVTFDPSGMLSNSVTLRIYDDYLVETEETFDLVLSVLGGNASPSSANVLTLSIISEDKLITSNENPGDTFFYGNNMQVPSNGGFFEGDRSDVRSRFILFADSLKSMGMVAGEIDMLSFFVFEKRSTATYENFRLGMVNTPISNLLGRNWLTTNTVFDGTFETVEGTWNPIDFTQAFTWDGISNIYVEMCYSNSSPIGDDKIVLYATGSSQSQVYGYSSNELENCGGVSSEAWTFDRSPVLQMRQKTNRKVENWAVNRASTYLQVGDKALMISGRDRVIASIENLGPSDLGCTEVAVRSEGEGRHNLDFANGLHSHKSYRLRSDNEASYSLTMYYTVEENAIWQSEIQELKFLSSQQPITAVHIDSSEIIPIQNQIVIPDLGNATAYRVESQGERYFAITNWSDPLLGQNATNETGTSILEASLLINKIGSGLLIHSESGERYALRINSVGDLLFFENTSISPVSYIPEGDLNLGPHPLEINADSSLSSFISVDNLGNLVREQNVQRSIEHLVLEGGYLEISEWGKGIIFKSHEGSCFKIYVDADGVLRTASTNCQ